MSSQGEPTLPTTPPPPTPTPTPDPKPPAGEDVAAIAAREKAEGKRAGKRELAESLGFKDEKEMQEFIAAKKKADEDQLSEAEKKIKDAEERDRKAQDREALAQQKVVAATVKAALIEAGVTKNAVDKVVPMVQIDSKLEDDELDKAVSDAVKALKKDLPALFSEQTPPPGSHPASPGKPNTMQDPNERAKEMVYLRHPELKKNKT